MPVIFGQQEYERNVLRWFTRIQNSFFLYTVELYKIVDVSTSVIMTPTWLIFRHLRIYLPSEFALALRLYNPVWNEMLGKV